jgi:hypothetical protein
VRWKKRRKSLLILAGILYVLFGVLAFFDIPGGHEEHHHTFAHNLTHIVLGIILLGLTFAFPPLWRRSLCFVVAGSYFVIGACGALLGHNHATLPIIRGLIEFHSEDYMVHIATGFFFLILGLLKRSDMQRTAFTT